MTFNERAVGLNNKTIFMAIVPAGLVYIAISYYGDDGRAVAAAVMLFTVITAVQFFWDLKNEPWFWGMMLLVAAIHAALLVGMTWGNGRFSVPTLVIVLPAIVVDFSAIYLVIRSAENAITPNGR